MPVVISKFCYHSSFHVFHTLFFKFTLESQESLGIRVLLSEVQSGGQWKGLPITLFFFPFFIGVQSKLLMHCWFTVPVFSF